MPVSSSPIAHMPVSSSPIAQVPVSYSPITQAPVSSSKSGNEEKKEYVKTYNPISSKEKEDTWNILISLEQEKCKTVIKEKKHLMLKNAEVLLNNGDRVNQIILGNRVKLFPVGFDGKKEVPYLPAGKLAELVVRKFHNKFHV